MIDPSAVQPVAPVTPLATDFWHAFLTFVAMFLAQRFHVLTGGNDQR